MHLDPRHPYERFMSRLASGQANGKSRMANRFGLLGASSHSLFAVRYLRAWLYGSVVVLIVAMLIWNAQRTQGIATASADSITGSADTFAVARAKALEASKLTSIELLKKAAPMIDGGDRMLAIELLLEANRRDPTIRDVNLQLGYAYLKAGNWTEAKAALNRAKELDSIYPETYQLLAVVYHQLGDSAGEQEALARAKQFELVAKLPELTR